MAADFATILLANVFYSINIMLMESLSVCLCLCFLLLIDYVLRYGHCFKNVFASYFQWFSTRKSRCCGNTGRDKKQKSPTSLMYRYTKLYQITYVQQFQSLFFFISLASRALEPIKNPKLLLFCLNIAILVLFYCANLLFFLICVSLTVVSFV